MSGINIHAIRAIYLFELHRFQRTLMTGLVVPALTTTLYFVVFGSAIGSRMTEVDGIPYGAFIVPGLIMLSMFTESIFNASFGIYMPKYSGTIYELLSAPISALETIIAYVGAAATKSMIIGLVILATAHLFVDLPIAHPLAMILFMMVIAISFCLFGFILGIWAQSFEQLQVIPLIVVMPMTFLGGAFYSIHMLPEPWRTITMFNPVVYLISGFRWTFFGKGDVAMGVSVAFVSAMLVICLAVIAWMFKTGYRLKK
ncbi:MULTISPECIES: ABC transporter permease [Sphingobium]|uniref:ABC transporter permease n=1 Tax=Sphingobium TaxID=165695 RepID=UPI0015EB2D38|nr:MULTISPECIES: ABC transporter permease [Sphingobium]MCW2361681.1 ABC-2 type transport system permease protein [Sphingobium sp. B10D3B]MCW2366524.1 ABC-2 type transport system permease protein [Sphingobium sp. B7D2B]MCW2394410.1 ABC-2 type transport system permease protein [Sphingobium sp. B8D3B]MCW2401640.1 ABC-2 type transport system permease protein [Sphingobium sp. B10D7B]MCW2408620.1 ABC-2 type transport system permease protein [Sphingobium xanthum]